ncbi:uncharacterized protein LOC130900003 isoform X1 [Diorhabda carinulata]|uniref:uncharacterized protein LOC130900003 isoform X1 n=2 Tax=Diorhabda carinulata TaxID=1163345 RepID=UPI0025A1EC7C|nr:uncharacterized protein LOC130900003 isoform X1 [Diorhabda carinulata]
MKEIMNNSDEQSETTRRNQDFFGETSIGSGNSEETEYVDIHEIHVVKAIEKKLNTNHFIVLNYNLIALPDKFGLLGEYRSLNVSFLNDQGSKENLHFYVKYFPQQESTATFAEKIGALKKEIFVYNLLEEFSEKGVSVSVVPNCYVVAPRKYLILDDLSNEGYKVVDKHTFLEYDSVLVVLGTLAKLHASTFIFEDKIGKQLLDLYYNDLEESFFNNKKDFANSKGIESCVKCIIEEIDLFGFPKKLFSGKYFSEVAEKMCYKIYDMVKPSKRFKNVVNHGDMWATNILFKYDKKTEKPICCKLVNFECARYSPPALDVLAFLYLTTSRDFRKKYMYEVVGMYYSYLEKNLKQAGLKIEDVLPFTDFMESCEELKLFAIIQAAFYFPLILIDSNEIDMYFSDLEMNKNVLFDNRIHLVLGRKDKDDFYKRRLIESIADLKDVCELAM